jgi:hypothetical protein
MAFWDFIKQLHLNDAEEKRRQQRGGFLNSVFGFLDDRLDNTGDISKKVWHAAQNTAGGATALARAVTTIPAVTAIASAEEKQQDYKKASQLDLINQLKDIKPEEREDFIKNNPVLANKLKDGKLQFTDTTAPWLFGNTFKDPKTMAEVDIKDNSQLEKLTSQIEEKDKSNDKGRQATNYFDRQIFGDQPIEAYQKREKGLEESGWSPAMAVLGTSVNMALDVPGPGAIGKGVKAAGKEIIEQLVKEGGDDAVKAVLKKTGSLADDVIEKIAPTIARSQDANAIDGILKAANSSVADRAASGKTAGELLDDALKSADVPKGNQVNINPVDDFVNAADPNKLTPDTPTVTPPVGRLSKEEEDFLGSFHSTSEIDKMGPKKGVTSKINEQTFDKNAPLTAFKEAYKQNTGQDLPTDFDPKAIMQLSNGNDAAAKLQLEPVTRALSGTKNLDDVRMLGMARHILSRRETLPTETVARAEAVLNNMQSRLGRDFAKTEEAVGTVIKFNQDQLQRLVDAEIISPESYKYLQEANPNYFSNMGLVDHILNDTTASKAFGASGSHNRSRENIIKAVRGFEDDSRAEFRDPIENIARTAAAVQKAVKDRELFNAIGEFEKIDPKLAFKQRISENVLKRMNLSLDNQELRPVRDKLDRMMRTRQMWVKKLQTESNNLEKKAYQTSLKEGGQSMPNFTPAGLGGAVPTSKATNKVVAQTPGEEQLMKAMGSPDGMPTPPKLGPQDTQAFLRSLVEGSPAKIERLRKQINTRDVNAHRILDEIDGMRSEYDDTVQRIISNSEEAKQLMDKELPKGMKAITSMKNGIQERIAVPEEIHAIYSGMNKAQQDIVNTTAKKMLQFTKESLTTYNPAFALVTNPIRDIAQSAFISKEVPLKDYLLVAPYAKRWLESFWGTLRQDSVYRAVNAAGGGNSGQFVDNLDPEKYAKQIEKRVHGKRVLGINSGVVVNNPADFLKLMAKVSVSPVIGAAKVIKKVGTTVEATTRGVEARAVKARGGSVKEAALGNRTVSTDFLEGGKSAQVVNNFLPFFNARLQGTRNVVKAIKENPKRASVLIGAGIGVPTATAYAWNMSNYKDEYEQVDQSVKDNNFVIFFGKGVNAKDQPNQFITIPKNDIQRFFSNPIENALRALNDDDPESFGVIATKMLSGTLPIDVAKDGELNASRTVGSILPPVPKAAVQYVTNKNLYNDSPLVPDNLKGLPPEEQVRETTSPIDSFIAKITPGQQSPIKVNAVRSAISGNTIRNPIDSLASPLTASANAPTSEFYSILNKTSQKHDSASKKINEALAKGDSMEARKIADEYNEGLKAAFRPWADKFGDKQTPELIDLYNKQKINLTKKSIKQRQTNIRKKASLANQ